MGSYSNKSDSSIMILTFFIGAVIIGLVIAGIVVMTKHKDNNDKDKDKYTSVSGDTNDCRCSSRFPMDGNRQPICNEACVNLGKCDKNCFDENCKKECWKRFQQISDSLCNTYPVEKRASCQFSVSSGIDDWSDPCKCELRYPLDGFLKEQCQDGCNIMKECKGKCGLNPDCVNNCEMDFRKIVNRDCAIYAEGIKMDCSF